MKNQYFAYSFDKTARVKNVFNIITLTVGRFSLHVRKLLRKSYKMTYLKYRLDSISNLFVTFLVLL